MTGKPPTFPTGFTPTQTGVPANLGHDCYLLPAAPARPAGPHTVEVHMSRRVLAEAMARTARVNPRAGKRPSRGTIVSGGVVHPYVRRPDGSWSGESEPVRVEPQALLPSVVGLTVLLSVAGLVFLAVLVAP